MAVRDAKGAILAHALTLDGGRIPKGRVLTDADIGRLEAAGVGAVTVARLDPGDVVEDAAAAALARAIAPDDAAGLRRGSASTGRVNVHATGRGVLVLDRQAFQHLNALDPVISVATLPPYRLVAPGELVATIKIVAYAIPEAVLTEAGAAGAHLAVRPVTVRSASLIETVIEGGPARSEKGRRAVAGRLDRLEVPLVDHVRVAHDRDALAEALDRAEGELLLILTASATSDIRDVAPEAVRVAGGTVSRFGLPVDPGNLLFFGHVGPRPVVGLPGCARSPALNGADWVLWRIACGLLPSDAEVAAMGVGGLLKESPARPHPREGRTRRLPEGETD